MIISHEDLSKLNDKQFEKLIKTLLMSIVGSGVKPFGQGKDGAREATYDGTANYPSSTDNWKGHWIFQVKYSNITFGIDKARNQIKYSIDNELKKLEEYGYFDSNKCENYIYITNVPFSGVADKGLHDYFQKKIQNYKVKNFDYWDGEKIISFLNTYPAVRETFFPSPGLEILEKKIFDDVNKTFVKPIVYDNFKEELLNSKILNIVGQPHVGKSFLALFLAQDIFNLKKLNEIIFIPIIDNLFSIPKITNCVIIFDDLYGDLNYDSIGKQTKIVSLLSKSNYVIITSRDYIFQEAGENKELINGKSFLINQEGAYTDVLLEEILLNHIKVNFPLDSNNANAYEYIIRNRLLIIRELRFPHNIQLFTTVIDKTIVTKKLLDEKISKAKLIENLVITWISLQQPINQNILLSLAIGKIQTKDATINICKMQWDYDQNMIQNCLDENIRLLYHDTLTIRFKHPSFKNAIVNYFLQNNKETISNLIINLILNLNSSDKKAINKSLAYQIIEGLDVEILINILNNKNIGSNYLEITWLTLFRKDKVQGLKLLNFLVNETPKGDRHFKCFITSKVFMKDKEIFSLIHFFMENRESHIFVDKLIEHFSYRIRLKMRPIIDSLNDKVSRDFNLKIKLLGSIGSKYPESVIQELISSTYDRSATNRRQVYLAINMLDRKVKDKIEAAFIEILTRETDKLNIKKIKNTLRRIRKM